MKLKTISQRMQQTNFTELMKKKYLSFFMMIFLMNIITVTVASGDHEAIFEQAEQIIQEKIPCESLTSEQLEILGDYYMEQMHPGELHEIMDERMGGEGSESLRQAHINMGLSFYCGQHGAFSGGMMGNYYINTNNNMMDNSYYERSRSIYFFNWLINFLLVIVLILLIVFLVKKIQKPKRKK